jgi:uncharacterized protein YyaL (SSP411 family)
MLLKMAAYTVDPSYREAAEKTLATVPEYAARAPMMFGQWLYARLLAEVGTTEVAIVGDPGSAETKDLVSVLYRSFRPDVVAAARPPASASAVPLLHGRELGREAGREVMASAWVCRRSTCSAPTTDAAVLETLLAP